MKLFVGTYKPQSQYVHTAPFAVMAEDAIAAQEAFWREFERVYGKSRQELKARGVKLVTLTVYESGIWVSDDD